MERVTLAHGSGGKMMHDLIDSVFMKAFGNSILKEKKDSAILKIGNKKMAFTTDSYVVNPIFFPGGDIGSLAVHGTVNDLSVCGARPLFISLGLIIEEGLDKRILERITESASTAARISGVKIVTGDTKVVERGSCDKIFINTSGIGEVYYDGLSVNSLRKGDAVIVSGTIGDHAVSVLSKREGVEFKTSVKSDSCPLNGLIRKVLESSGGVKFMRDPTRGGLATTLNEIVKGRQFGIEIDEEDVPLSVGVKSACELLGFDPLYLACEGRVLLVADKKDAGKILHLMHRHKYGKRARVIGRISDDHKGRVYLNTVSGSRRILDMLPGEQLPRIC